MKKIATLIICICSIMLMSVPVSAEYTETPCDASLSVEVDNGGTVEIEAVSSTEAGDPPMPAQKQLVVNDKAVEYVMHYTEPGEYVYRVKQVPGTNAAMTYDKTVYLVSVIVTHDESGKLRPVVIIKEDNKTEKPDSIRFKNVIETPTPTPTVIPTVTPTSNYVPFFGGKSSGAQTSDNINAGIIIALIACTAALTVIVVRNKKKNKETK